MSSPTGENGPQNPYGQNPYGQSPYGQDPQGQSPYGQGPDHANPYGRPQPDAPAYGTGAPGQGRQPGAQPGQQFGQAQPGQQFGQQFGQAQFGQAQPGQQFGQAQFGQQPSGPVPPPQRPGSITAAFWLILAAGALMALTNLLAGLALQTEVGRQTARELMSEQLTGAGITGEQLDQVLENLPTLMTGILAVSTLVGLGLYLLIAFLIRNGSRAGRIVGAVLAGISVVMVLMNLAGGAFSPLELVWVGLGAAGIVAAFRPSATEFMRQRAWYKTLRLQQR